MLLNTCFFSPLWLRANARRSCHWWPSFRGKKNWKQKTCSTGGKGSLTSDTRDDFDLVINRHQHTQVHPPISPNNQLPPTPPHFYRTGNHFFTFMLRSPTWAAGVTATSRLTSFMSKHVNPGMLPPVTRTHKNIDLSISCRGKCII